jgi:hypothetical protein
MVLNCCIPFRCLLPRLRGHSAPAQEALHPALPKLYIGHLGRSFLIALVGVELRRPLEASGYTQIPTVSSYCIDQPSHRILDRLYNFLQRG